MTSPTAVITHSAFAKPKRNVLNIYLKEAKYQLLGQLRLPTYSLSVILFPVMFYSLFGLLLNRGHELSSVSVSTYLMATYATFGVMGAALFGIGAGLAIERGQGWLQVKRASPMPPFAYFTAKIAMAMSFSLVVVVILLGLGVAFGQVQITVGRAAILVGILVAGAIPFCAMGLVIGYLIGPNSAPGIINLIYLPLSFASGLWFPIEVLPSFLQHAAVALPPYHLAELALGAVGAQGTGSAVTHWEVLLGFTLICLGIARIAAQREEGKLYG